MKKKIIKIAIFITIILVLLLNHIYMFNKSENVDYVFSNCNQLKLDDTIDFEMEDNKLIQTIYATNNNLKKIKIYIDPLEENQTLGDYLETNIELELKDKDGNTIKKYKYEKNFFGENDKSITFEFPKIGDSENKEYYLSISTYKTDNNSPIKLGKNNGDDHFSLYIDGELSEYSLFYRTVYEYNVFPLFYLITTILIVAFVFLLVIINVFKKRLTFEKKYFIIAIIACLCMNFLTPLFFGNDETAHWTRTYEIANGNLVTDVIDGWPRSYVPSKALEISFNTYDQIPSKMTREYAEVDNLVNMEYMAVYSPISYVPQVIGFWVGKLVTNNLFVSAYMARFFETLFCLVCFYFAIKIIPFGKKIVFLIGLLPSVVAASSLLTADAMLFATTILFISKILQIVYEKKEMKIGDSILLGILSIIIAISKLVYFPICLFILFIPLHNKKDKNNTKNWFIVLGILALSFLITGLWNGIALQNLTSGQGVNVGFYIRHYLKNPIELFQITFYTFYISIGNFISDMFGGMNAWYGTNISDASIFPQLFMFLFVLLALKEENKLEKNDKILIGILLIITYLLISTSLLFTCTPAYYIEIIGIQGRYFIPFLLPIALLIANNNKIKMAIDLENIIIFTYFAYFLKYMIMYI